MALLYYVRCFDLMVPARHICRSSVKFRPIPMGIFPEDQTQYVGFDERPENSVDPLAVCQDSYRKVGSREQREPHIRPAEVRDVPVIAESKNGHDSKDSTSMRAVAFVPRYARN